jgi:hypothetical protein
MLLDWNVIGLAAMSIFENDSNRTRHIQLIASFVAIGYTMFLTYRLMVDYLKRGRRPLGPAPDPFASLAPTGPPPSPAQPEKLLKHGTDSSGHGEARWLNSR